MASAFRAQSRSVRRFVGLPSIEKVALWPTVDAILADFRADHQEIADHIVLAALNGSLTHAMFDGDYFGVYDALGKLLGLHGQDGKLTLDGEQHFHPGKSRPAGEVPPAARETGNAKTARVSDAEMRRLAGAPMRVPK